MAKGMAGRVGLAAAALSIIGPAMVAVPTAALAQVAVGTGGESPSDALARNMKVLGSSPGNFDALIGAGRAALALGDTQAAAGFFGRADEAWSTSPLPQAGIGAALAQQGDGNGALQYFSRAVQRGATQSMIGCDRGLAYDLLGRHRDAQADYRAALIGHDGDEARRRLALSLAITGNKTDALSTLSPLMARGDAGAARTRAFVLALTGDSAGAKNAIESAMPGSASHMAYFFQKLPALRSDQKAAAVNLGIFPSASGLQTASVQPPIPANPVKVIYGRSPKQSAEKPTLEEEDRIASIQEWLSQATKPGGETATTTGEPASTVQVASTSIPTTVSQPSSASPSTTSATRRLWIQLASGPNATALPDQFVRLKTRNRELFEGISGYIAEEPGKARLLIGPFRNDSEASIFADDLASVHIDAFTWTNQPGQSIRKLQGE